MQTVTRVAALAKVALLAGITTVHSKEIIPENEPLQIVVSIFEQRLAVYRGNQTIAESRVSSGKRGYSTPAGIYSILHKKKRHYSNLYRNAPMPYMQRLTWTGIALHGSDSVPSYPASHGCIRLPAGFASDLYGLTEIGAHVIVNGSMVAPAAIDHPVLPQPAPSRKYSPTMDQWRLRIAMGAVPKHNISSVISTAAMLAPVRHRINFEKSRPKGAPLRILITRRTQRETVMDVQRLLNRLGHNAGVKDGVVGRDTRAAIRRFQAGNGLEETGAVAPQLISALYEEAGQELPLNGRLLVRSDFKPVFSAPISIRDETVPLGTHLLTATDFDRKAGVAIWNALTLENRLSDTTRAIYGIDPDASEKAELSKTLDRITIPRDLREKLSDMLTPGSSIAITDNGPGRYTGWKTDFVVSTRLHQDTPSVSSQQNSVRAVSKQRSRGKVTPKRSRRVEASLRHRRHAHRIFFKRLGAMSRMWLER